MWKPPLWPHVHASNSTRQKTHHNTLLMADIKTSHGSMITPSFDPFYFSVRIPFLDLLLLYSSSSLEDKVSDYFPFPFLYICPLTRASPTDWLEGLMPLIYISTTCTYYWLLHLGRGHVDQWRLKLPLLPQSLGRKLPRIANRELAGLELDCQAKVSKGLTPLSTISGFDSQAIFTYWILKSPYSTFALSSEHSWRFRVARCHTLPSSEATGTTWSQGIIASLTSSRFTKHLPPSPWVLS